MSKHIRKLCVSGVITTDPYQILEEQRRFYNSLYESQSNDTNDKLSETFLSNLKMPKLSEEQKQSCEGEKVGLDWYEFLCLESPTV